MKKLTLKTIIEEDTALSLDRSPRSSNISKKKRSQNSHYLHNSNVANLEKRLARNPQNRA